MENLVRIETAEGSTDLQLVVDAVVILTEDESNREVLEEIANHLKAVIKRGVTED